MLTVGFDAAGKETDQEHLVVAGFVSTANDWMDFDKAWREKLKLEGKEYFHRSEYGRFVKPDSPRERFFLDLIEIIRTHTYQKFGCTVPIKLMYEILSPEIKKHFHMHSFVLASLYAISQVRKWQAHETGFREKPIRWVFERGDAGKGLLEKAMLQAGEPIPQFEFKKDQKFPDGREEKAFTPLQAADFLAYELFQVGSKYADVPGRTSDYNYAFIDAFRLKHGEPSYLIEDTLRGIDDVLRLQKITYEWAKERLF